MKKQTSIVEKQYQGLNMLFKSDKKKEERVTTKKEKTTIISESKLTYGSRYSFSDNKNVKKYSGLSFTTKYDKLLSFYHWLNELKNLIPRKEKTKNKKKNVYINGAIIYNSLLAICFKYYNKTTDERKRRDQTFIQAVLLISVFEQRSSFWIFCFMTNDHKVIVKYKCGSGGDVSSAVGSWHSLGGSSGGKSSEKFWFFYILRAKNSLK